MKAGDQFSLHGELWEVQRADVNIDRELYIVGTDNGLVPSRVNLRLVNGKWQFWLDFWWQDCDPCWGQTLFDLG